MEREYASESASPLPDLSRFQELRERIHVNPELSHREHNTANIISEYLHALNVLTVHQNVGGMGVVAVFHNRPGNTILIRSDMDALPILEQAEIPFASTATQEDIHGVRQPVMHACGHDLHICMLLAAVEALVKTAAEWSGTLIALFQQAEEQGTGAQAMLDGGLYSLVPVPDVVLSQHVHVQRAGKVGIRDGPVLTAADYLKVTFHGRGGHGSFPHRAIDPVIMAANAILQLQTVVSRESDPTQETVILTVGRVRAGQAENVIPDTAELGLSLRTQDENTRKRCLAAIRRIVKAASDSGGADKEPDVVTVTSFPPTINDRATVEKLRIIFEREFGSNFNPDLPRVPASEDFSLLATSVDRPCAIWFIGCTDPLVWDQAEKSGCLDTLPQNHSPFFNAATQPTLQVGALAMYRAARAFLTSNSE